MPRCQYYIPEHSPEASAIGVMYKESEGNLDHDISNMRSAFVPTGKLQMTWCMHSAVHTVVKVVALIKYNKKTANK